MQLILDDIRANSKAWDAYYSGKRITIVTGSWFQNRESFTELHNFFTQSLGPTLDLDAEQLMYPKIKQVWTYQIDNKHGQHRFFVKSKEHLDWFLLKYSDTLTRWAR